MKVIYIFLCYLSIVSTAYAQNIEVKNRLTDKVIPGVAIYNVNKTKSTVTDLDGQASLDKFSSEEIIYFQHLAHAVKSLKKSLLVKTRIVYLYPNTQDLDEIVISASKFQQEKKDIPQKVLSVNSKSIQFSNPQTSADLLGSTGHVYIQKSQLGGGSPMIRGFSTNRLLLTVDGVRMNNAIFRGGNIQNVISIDPFSIQNTEVILGAGAVIYGSDAIGGVMSFYTQTPKLSFADSLLFNTNTILRYASASDEKTAHIDLNFGYKHWAFLTNVSYSNFNDLKMGKYGPEDYLRNEFIITKNSEDLIVKNSDSRIQKFTGYNQINLMQKVRYEPYNNLSFDLGLFYTTTSDIPRYDRLIRYRDNELRSAEWSYGPQQWFMAHGLVTRLSSASNLYDKLKASMAYQNFQESRKDRNYQSTVRNIREETLDAYAFNLDFEKSLSDRTELFYGLEYVYNKVMSEGKAEQLDANISFPTLSRYPNGSSWQSAAAYFSLKYKPNSKFVFQSGARFNHILAKANFQENNAYLNLPFESTTFNAGAITGTAGISWSPSDLLQWKFNISSAFRAPNLDDLGKVFDSEPGSVVVPNKNLRPEYAYGGELGLKMDFKKKVMVGVATYYTYLDNALVRRDYNLNGASEIIYDGEISNVQAIQNASKAWIYGFEANLTVNFTKALMLRSQFNILGGTEDNDGIEVPVRHVAPNFGNTHFIWKNNGIKIDFFANYNSQLSFNQMAPSEIGKDYIYALNKDGNPYSPSWYTLNFTAQYKISDAVVVTTSLENISNQRYKTYSSGIAASGRNLILSLKYSL